MTVEAVRAAVSAVQDPELRRSLGELEMVRDIAVEAGHARVGIALTIVGCPASDRIEKDVRAAALSAPGVASVDVELGVMTPAERAALTERLRAGRPQRENPFGPDSLTRVIAITSGKGGVGKSTLTANLAVSLAARGLAVGLIDADVHGYSIPALLGLTGPDGLPPQPTRIDGLMIPPIAHEVRAISIGMFLPRGTGTPGAVAWRGPMLHRTISQFLTEVYFGDLDVLLIDMPPGTGDIAISVGQLLPHAEVVVVTTPQSAASDIAVRSGLVARQTGQRVVGVVENMGPLRLPDGTVVDVFGSGGGALVAAALSEAGDVPLLGSVPLSPALRGDADAGTPVVLTHPEDAAARAIDEIADALIGAGRDRLSGRPLPLRVR